MRLTIESPEPDSLEWFGALNFWTFEPSIPIKIMSDTNQTPPAAAPAPEKPKRQVKNIPSFGGTTETRTAAKPPVEVGKSGFGLTKPIADAKTEFLAAYDKAVAAGCTMVKGTLYWLKAAE